ncbi:hypothetical protein C8Q74DRAFT_746443 [Fomes fomentarius]|nr:hypothetical protein C8Q74DRAFT_746443 [Fomes fomentarius]
MILLTFLPLLHCLLPHPRARKSPDFEFLTFSHPVAICFPTILVIPVHTPRILTKRPYVIFKRLCYVLEQFRLRFRRLEFGLPDRALRERWRREPDDPSAGAARPNAILILLPPAPLTRQQIYDDQIYENAAACFDPYSHITSLHT